MADSTSRPLDASSPLVLSTRELPRGAGEMREVARTAPAPAGLGLPMIGVPEGAELDLDLRMESATEGVFVSGTVTAPLHGECGRCLQEISDTLQVHVGELFAYPGSTTDETTDADEVRRLQDELADLEPVVRDAVVLELPSTPLCRPDCPGLCAQCGQPMAELPPDHAHESLDPRWSALAGWQDGPAGS